MTRKDQREDPTPRELGKRRAMRRVNSGRPRLTVLPPRLKELERPLEPAPYKKPKWD
jgi:hypothetical protein